MEHSRSLQVVLVFTTIVGIMIGCQRGVDPAIKPPKAPELPPRFAITNEEGSPILEQEQIASYEWATHKITLMPGAALDVRVKEGDSIVHGIPFLVAADGVICYRGVVTTSASSRSQSVPVINIQPLQGRKGLVQIELGYPSREFFKGDDPRGDERVRNVLRKLGKLKE